MDKLLHTPEGVRDIYNSECAKKMQVEHKLMHRIHCYGFRDIQTPMFEFFDIFNKERGTVASKDMYKFFDREGNTLVLRPDITPSIARCVAKYYKEETMPIRLCYSGSTFINNSSYQGKLKESTQIGAELINEPSVEADAEMIALTVECLKDAGLEEFLVEIGQADFFAGLMEEARLTKEEKEQLRLLIENKNMFGVEELLADKQIDTSLKQIIVSFDQLSGSIEQIQSAMEQVKNPRALAAFEHLMKVHRILTAIGYEKYITYDLGMLSKYNYYTGIIFRAITYGTGEAVITGGRYDSLVGQFGKSAPAIGMAIMADALMAALTRQKLLTEPEHDHTLILYQEEYCSTAFLLAQQFRMQEMKVELFCVKETIELSDYIAYCNRTGIGGILYLNDPDVISVVNAADGTINQASMKQMLH